MRNKQINKSLKTYQDTLGNEGDSTVHRSVGDIQVVGRNSTCINTLLVNELKKIGAQGIEMDRTKK